MIKIVHPKGTGRQIKPDTKIVRYMKLEVLLLILKGWVFIPSYATLGKSDPLETNLLFSLPNEWDFWTNHADKIGSRLDSFVSGDSSRRAFFLRFTDGTGKVSPLLSHSVRDVQKASFPRYVDELATRRCIWCWNEFRSFSNALWYLYGERGVAVRSTVGEVTTALTKAGVVRGIVAPIEYINHEDNEFPSVLMDVKNILSPYLLKSIAFDYEKEVRFILGTHEAEGGVLIPIDASNFIREWRPSPHLQKEEQSAIRSIVDGLLGRSESEEPPLDSNWHEHASPFTKQDEYAFPDLL